MKVGVNILNFGPGVSAEMIGRWAQTAEALGYHSVFISDHVAITSDVGQRYPEPYYDPFMALAWLAGQTKSLQLGTTVCVLPYRNPILTARLVANIDQLSQGRFIFGVGVGGAEDEFKALGIPFARRGRLADESLAAMKLLWAADDPVSFSGRLIKFDDVAGIAPVQRPYPSIWVGGGSDAAMKRAAVLGDAWHPILRTASWLKETGLSDLRRVAEQAGRPVPRFCPRIRLDIRDQPLDGDRIPGTGSLDQVRQDIIDIERLGAEHLVLDWYTGDLPATRNHEHGWQMLAMLADKVFDLPNQTLR